MLGALFTMYTASGVHWGLNCYTVMKEIRDPNGWMALPPEDVYRWSLITSSAVFFLVSTLDFRCGYRTLY